MKKLCFLFASICMALSVSAQHLDAGFSIGNASYIGDILTPRNGSHATQINPAFTLFTRWNTKHVNFNLRLMHTALEGSDLKGLYPERKLEFRTPLTEAAFTIEWNIIDVRFNYDNSYLTPYLFGGLAAYKFNPQREYEGEWIDLQPLGTEGQGIEGYDAPYKLVQLAIPFGAGLNLKVNKRLGLKFEFGVRKLFTDYLDDISGTNINYADLVNGNGQLAADLSIPADTPITDSNEVTYKRGSNDLDMYFVYEASFFYSLGSDKKLRCSYR